MGTLSPDAVITLLLYLIGAPALMIQSADSSVRYVLMHALKRVTFMRAIVPAVAGLAVAITAFVLRDVSETINASSLFADVVVLVLLALVILISLFSLPISRKRDVVRLMKQKILREAQPAGMIDDDDLKALTLLGSESDPGDQKGWTISALAEITQSILKLKGYSGCQLESIVESLRKVILDGSKIGSPENFLAAIEMLRPVIDLYYKKSKQDPNFSDADLDYAYKLLCEMGKEAVNFSLEGVSSSCIGTIGSYDILIPAASQRLSEIGTAAIEKNRMGVAMAALHMMEWAINNSETAVEDEILYDYAGILGAFWSHGESAQKLVKQNLDNLKRTVNLRKVIGDAIHHHSLVSRFTVADHIRTMWDGYLRLA